MARAAVLTWACLAIVVAVPSAAAEEYWERPETFGDDPTSNYFERWQALAAQNPDAPLSRYVQPGCRTYDMDVDQVSPTMKDHMKMEHLIDLPSFGPIRMCERMPFCNFWDPWELDTSLFDSQDMTFAPDDAQAAEWVVADSAASTEDDVARAPLFNGYQWQGPELGYDASNSNPPQWTSLPCHSQSNASNDGLRRPCIRRKRCLRSGIDKAFIEGKMQPAAAAADNRMNHLWGEPTTDGCNYMFVAESGYYLVTAYTELTVVQGYDQHELQYMPKIYSPEKVASSESLTVIVVHRTASKGDNGFIGSGKQAAMCTDIDLLGMMDRLPCSNNGVFPSLQSWTGVGSETCSSFYLDFRWNRWEKITSKGMERNSYSGAFKGFSLQLQDFLYDDFGTSGRELTDWYSYDIHNAIRSMGLVLVGVNYTGKIQNQMTLDGQGGWFSDPWWLQNEYAKDMMRKLSFMSAEQLLQLLNGRPAGDIDDETQRLHTDYESAAEVMADGTFGLVCADTQTETSTLYPNDGLDTYEVLAGCVARTNAIKQLGEVMAGRKQGDKLTISAEIGVNGVKVRVDDTVAAQIVEIWDPVLRTLYHWSENKGQRVLGGTWDPSNHSPQQRLGPCQLETVEPVLRSSGYQRLDQVTGTTLQMCPSTFAEGENQGVLVPMRAMWFGVLISVITSILTVISNDKLGERFPLKDGLFRADLKAVRALQVLNFVTAFLSGTYLAADVKETMVGPSVELIGFVATQSCQNNTAPPAPITLPVYGEHDVRVTYTEDDLGILEGSCTYATSVTAVALALFAVDIAVSLITFAYVWYKFNRSGKAGDDALESPKLDGPDCVTCMKPGAMHVCVPCGHQCLCDACAEEALSAAFKHNGEMTVQCPVCHGNATMIRICVPARRDGEHDGSHMMGQLRAASTGALVFSQTQGEADQDAVRRNSAHADSVTLVVAVPSESNV